MIRIIPKRKTVKVIDFAQYMENNRGTRLVPQNFFLQKYRLEIIISIGEQASRRLFCE